MMKNAFVCKQTAVFVVRININNAVLTDLYPFFSPNTLPNRSTSVGVTSYISKKKISFEYFDSMLPVGSLKVGENKSFGVNSHRFFK